VNWRLQSAEYRLYTGQQALAVMSGRFSPLTAPLPIRPPLSRPPAPHSAPLRSFFRFPLTAPLRSSDFLARSAPFSAPLQCSVRRYTVAYIVLNDVINICESLYIGLYIWNLHFNLKNWRNSRLLATKSVNTERREVIADTNGQVSNQSATRSCNSLFSSTQDQPKTDCQIKFLY